MTIKHNLEREASNGQTSLLSDVSASKFTANLLSAYCVSGICHCRRMRDQAVTETDNVQEVNDHPRSVQKSCSRRRHLGIGIGEGSTAWRSGKEAGRGTGDAKAPRWDRLAVFQHQQGGRSGYSKMNREEPGGLSRRTS